MRNILVIGYYYRNNLGDDLFIETIPNFFPNSNLDFISADDLSKDITFDKYSGIIFGGGDLINSYFHRKILEVRKKFQGPIFAFSIGIPYYESIQKGFLQPFDHVFTRNKKYLIPLQYELGSQYVHYLPDAVMSYSSDFIEWNGKNNNTIGIFLPNSINIPCIMLKLVNVLRIILTKNTDLKLHLICFDTQKDSKNNDNIINTVIWSSLEEFQDRIINDNSRYSGSEMLSLLAGFKMSICSRFHSNILSLLTSTPFVSFHYANKVELLIQEKGLDDIYCPIDVDHQAKAKDFNNALFLDKFNYVISNLDNISSRLKKIRDKDRSICKNHTQAENLISLNIRRNITPCHYYTDKVDNIFNIFEKQITNITKTSLEKSAGILKEDESQKISRDLIYEITGEISSRYVDGTIKNLINNPENLRDMIVWVWKDKLNKMAEEPRFNMLTTCIKGFEGIHRSGWKFVLNTIHSLHSEYGVILDVYCDSTFGWSRENPCQKYGILPYTSPWCGFFHHTPNSGHSSNNIVNSTSNIEFIKSLETCLGLFVLSECLATWLRNYLKQIGYENIPVVSLIHPTSSFGILPFNIPKEDEIINIVNIGAWLRNSYSIYALDLPKDKFRKYKLKGKMMDGYFPPKPFNIKSDLDSSFMFCLNKYILENNLSEVDLQDKIIKQINSVTVLEYLPDKEYDLLLSKYVVFVDFLECAAANTIIECMARGNPIIVNKLPSIIEYLGEEYPLYFNNINEIKDILTYENIKKAEKYIKSFEIRDKISSEKFYNDFTGNIIAKRTMLKQYIQE